MTLFGKKRIFEGRQTRAIAFGGGEKEKKKLIMMKERIKKGVPWRTSPKDTAFNPNNLPRRRVNLLKGKPRVLMALAWWGN